MSDAEGRDPAPGRTLGTEGVRKRLPAGVLDASMASLATFATSLAAVNVFDATDLGAYAVFFTAFLFGQSLAQHLIYTPSEIAAVNRSLGERLDVFRDSVRFGSVAGVAGAGAAGLAALVTSNATDPDVVFGLAVTSAAAIFLSPTQDHVRRLLHIDGSSWSAAVISGVQLVVAATSVGVLVLSVAPAAWVPFGALALANLASLVTGLLLVHNQSPLDHARVRLGLARVLKAGGWLLIGSLVPTGAGFVADAIIFSLAGSETLGFAEAARVVAQPVLVLGMGLIAVLGPRNMEAAIERNRRVSRRAVLGFLALIGIAGVGYLAVAGVSWVLNPMAYLVRAAYEVEGLVAVTIGANLLIGIYYLLTSELTAARKERSIAAVAATATPIRLLVAATAGVTGAFARPLSVMANNSVAVTLYQVIRRRHYADEAPGGDPEALTV